MSEADIPVCDKCGAETYSYPQGDYCPRCDIEKIIEIAKQLTNNLRLISE